MVRMAGASALLDLCCLLPCSQDPASLWLRRGVVHGPGSSVGGDVIPGGALSYPASLVGIDLLPLSVTESLGCSLVSCRHPVFPEISATLLQG